VKRKSQSTSVFELDGRTAGLVLAEFRRAAAELPVATPDCPSEASLAAHFAQTLSSKEHERLDRHVESCGHCAGLLDFLSSAAVRSPRSMPAVSKRLLPSALRQSGRVEQLWRKLKESMTDFFVPNDARLRAFADSGGGNDQIEQLSYRHILCQTPAAQAVLYVQGRRLFLSLFRKIPSAITAFSVFDHGDKVQLQREGMGTAQDELKYNLGPVDSLYGHTLQINLRVKGRQYNNQVRIGQSATASLAAKRRIEEIQYHFDALGNYIRGLQAIADELLRNPTDRHLHDRFKRYLLKKLKDPTVPWLPSSYTLLGFPPDIADALDSVPGHSFAVRSEIGEVLLPLVDGTGEGFVRLFRCKHDETHRPSRFSANVSATMRDGILRACHEVDRYLKKQYCISSVTGPETGFAFEVVGGPLPATDETLEGHSIEAAAALAFLSLRTQVPVASDIAVTGRLDGLTIGAVDGIGEKLEALLRERPYLTRIFLPRANADALPTARAVQLEAVSDFPALIDKVFQGRFRERINPEALDIGGILSAALKDYYSGDYPTALSLLKGLLAQLPVSRGHRYHRFICWWRVGSIATHWGDIAQADTAFAQALELADHLWNEGRLGSDEYLNLYVSYAVHLTDLYRYEKAERALCDNPVRRGGHRYQNIVEVRRLGSLGQLYRFSGRFSEAEQVLKEALQLIDPDTEPHELAREHTYLGTVYTDLGRFELAARLFHEADVINQGLVPPSPLNEVFAAVFASRLWYRSGEFERSRREAERALALSSGFERVFPGCIARRYQALSLIALGQKEEGRRILREEMLTPVGAVDWPSPNIRLIRDKSVIELLVDLLSEKDWTPAEINPLVHHLLAGLQVFASALDYFRADIAHLRRDSAAKQLKLAVMRKHLAALSVRIHE
jgi:tetratricopeptide (TPR) repeat protein